MSVMSALARFFGQYASAANGSTYPIRAHVDARTRPVDLPQRELYALLRLFYLNVGLYDELARSSTLVGRSSPNLKSIRNTVPAVVDFFGGKLLPDPLEVVTERAAITDPIEQVWAWSNWGQNRRLFGRYVALFGEAYLKVVASQERERVFFEVISPEQVTDFATDERGYLTMIRLDILRSERQAGGTWRRYTYTEHWSKDDNLYRSWETDGDVCERALEDLGTPMEAFAITDLGIDFLPFARAVFRDLGEKRGIGAVQLALEAIVEADLSATNLHSMVYQDAEGAWVLKSVGFDDDGRPIAAPRVGNAPADGQPGKQSDGSVSVGKRSFWTLPGNQELQSVVADIDYAGSLAILKDHDEHLERLMPALAYARISELSGADLSGRALRFKLTPVIDQVQEVRANAVASLVQADQMALTLAQVNGIPGFEGLGSFDAGDFEHTIKDTDVLPVGDYEEAQTEVLEAQAFQAWTTAGLPMAEALKRADYTEEEAADIVNLAADEAEANMERQQQMMGGQTDQQQQDQQEGAQNGQ